MSMPIRIHPGNNKIFEFRDKPVVLVYATEYYGADMNRPFDYGFKTTTRYARVKRKGFADEGDKKVLLLIQ